MNLLWADDVSWYVVVVLWPFVTVVAVDRIAVGVPIISLPFALHFTYTRAETTTTITKTPLE